MDESRRKHLEEMWVNNERRLQEALDLKAGPDSPVERVDELNRAQDEIEHELGEEWLKQRRKDRRGDGERHAEQGS